MSYKVKDLQLQAFSLIDLELFSSLDAGAMLVSK